MHMNKIQLRLNEFRRILREINPNPGLDLDWNNVELIQVKSWKISNLEFI